MAAWAKAVAMRVAVAAAAEEEEEATGPDATRCTASHTGSAYDIQRADRHAHSSVCGDLRSIAFLGSWPRQSQSLPMLGYSDGVDQPVPLAVGARWVARVVRGVAVAWVELAARAATAAAVG